MSKIFKLFKIVLRRFKRFGIISLWFPVYLKFIIRHGYRAFTIFTQLTKIERLLLYKLALSLKENSVIVEIGSYLGASASFLASAAKEKNHIVFCVDTWKNDAMSEGERDTFDEFCKNTQHLQKYIRTLRGKSVEIAKTFNNEIDLLFIDGDHSYEGVRADVEAWLPKVKDGGIVVFHDIGWAEGVQRVVNEYIKPLQIEEQIIENTYYARIKK
ncbi:MAG: 1-O-methyltransferase [Rikenellaceae bacterium]|nr:1-O-methyltransferase [Rikenellaceae bacterium]